jgi:hypothetical protein
MIREELLKLSKEELVEMLLQLQGHPSAYSPKIDPDTTYRPPPGRVVVTPETPFGHIDREADTAVNLWKQLGLPILADEISQSSISSAGDSPRSLAEQRIDRGRRGVKKGNILANRRFSAKFMSGVGTEEDIRTVEEAVFKIDWAHFALHDVIPDNMFKFTLLAKKQLILATTIGNSDEKECLRCLREQTEYLSGALKTLSNHLPLSASFDRILSDNVLMSLDKAGINIMFEVDDSKSAQLKKLMYFGSSSAITNLCLQFIANSTTSLLSELETSAKIIGYAQYKFVDDLAQIWHAYTGRMPEIGRWYSPSAKDSSFLISRFDQFVRVLEPKIKAETIRTVLDAYRDARERNPAEPGNEEPSKN